MKKWWIDKSGNIHECAKVYECKVPDDNYHLELSQRLWSMTTEEALDAGMVRAVLYKGEMQYEFRHSRTHKQMQACNRLDDDCCIGQVV